MAHLTPWLLQVGRTALWLVLLSALFAPLERLFPIGVARRRRGDFGADLAWYWINSLTPIFLLGPPAALLAMAAHAMLPPVVGAAVAALPLWARMVLAMIVGELGFYWGHRWSHEWPWLWRFHAVHHSATRVDFLVNTRAHPIDMVFTRLCGLTLLFATGLAAPVGPHPTLVPALVLFVGSMWSFFIHANLRWRLGPLEELIASPAFHHWHHTLEDHRDHNYAAMLPFMDRLFGTFYLPKTWPAAYGAATPVASTLTGQFVDPFRPARTAAAPEPVASARAEDAVTAN